MGVKVKGTGGQRAWGVEGAMSGRAVRHPGQVVPGHEDAEIARQRWSPGRIRVPSVQDGTDSPHWTRDVDKYWTD